MLDTENIYDIEDKGKNVIQLENITYDHIQIKSYLYSGHLAGSVS